MFPIDGVRPIRIKGTLDVELADGRVASLDVDLDVSGRESGFAIDNRWDEEHLGRDAWWNIVRPTMLTGTAYTLYLPTPLATEEERQIFRLRVPKAADGEA